MYEKEFESNEIDGLSLLTLSQEELKDYMYIESDIDRKNIYKAIQKMNNWF